MDLAGIIILITFVACFVGGAYVLWRGGRTVLSAGIGGFFLWLFSFFLLMVLMVSADAVGMSTQRVAVFSPLMVAVAVSLAVRHYDRTGSAFTPLRDHFGRLTLKLGI